MASAADRVKDIGPQPQSFDIERATKDNTNYRSVAWSGRYLQVTLMSIPVGGDIGLEAHPETDQFLRLDAGSGRSLEIARERKSHGINAHSPRIILLRSEWKLE